MILYRFHRRIRNILTLEKILKRLIQLENQKQLNCLNKKDQNLTIRNYFNLVNK